MQRATRATRSKEGAGTAAYRRARGAGCPGAHITTRWGPSPSASQPWLTIKVQDRDVRHVAVVGIDPIAERPVDLRGPLRTYPVDRQEHVEELRRFENERRIGEAGRIAFGCTATEEVGVALVRRNVVAADRRRPGLRGRVSHERVAGSLPAGRCVAGVEVGLLVLEPGDEVMVERRVVVLDDGRGRFGAHVVGCRVASALAQERSEVDG